MKKRFKIIILPTEKASKLFISTVNNKICFENEEKVGRAYAINQHLYIVDTQANIKDDDYCIDDIIIFGPYRKGDIAITKFEKIIATTDKSFNLPIIPNKLVQEYIEKPSEYIDFDKWVVSPEQVDSILNHLFE